MTRPYPRYRDSEVDWMGEIPEHWDVKRIKHVASYRTSSVDKKTTEGEPPVRLCNYTDVYYREKIRASDGGYMRATASLHEIARFGLAVGDVLITKDSEDWRDIAVPALIEESSDDFVCGYHVGIIRSGSMTEPGFMFRALQSAAVNEQIQVSASGVTRFGVPNSAIGETLLPLPPRHEQRSIAAFLDRRTAEIDALIANKRLLIERLSEYRTALITRTVTRGLPPAAAEAAGLAPDPPMKDTGVEWIGAVPEHWVVRQFKWIVVEPLKYGANAAADMDDPGLPRFVRITDIAENGHLRDETFRSLPFDVAKPYLLEDGDLLLARSGSVGRTFLYDKSWGSCAFAGYLVRARVNRTQALPRFISHFCRSHSYMSWIRTEAIQATIANVSAERYSRMPIPLPPLDEQRAIGDFLDRRAAEVDVLCDGVEAAIERLQEYRTALVTAAVTGKIDVREAVGAEMEGCAV